MQTSSPRLRACLSTVVAALAFTAAGVALSDDAPRPTSARQTGLESAATVERWVSPRVNVAGLRSEDVRDRARPGVARRVGFPMRTDLSPADSGTWEELPGGDRLWRLRLVTAGARWTVVGLETFQLEPGARLFAYDASGETLLGPYTSRDVRRHGQLWLPPIEGDTVILELDWPASMGDQAPKLQVGTVSHGYEAWGGFGGIDDGGAEETPTTDAAGACNVDVNCPAGDLLEDQKRGVVQLLSGGYAFCTGSLINSTDNSCRPYVLTAAHCGAGPSTIFRFNYERPGCESGTPTTDQLRTGASVRASYDPSDFALLEMDDAPPAEFEAYYNGWRRSNLNTFSTWGIHHPSGDVKKISANTDPLSSGQFWGAGHWRVNDWEMGTTEPGSSGSPLFDSNGRIIGQLHGGTASCLSNGWDEYGKLSASWSGGGTPATSLRDWLDPQGTGAMALDGIDGSSCFAPQPELHYAGLVVDDSAGNGNGIVEPGETLSLRVRLANDGTLAATGVLGALSSTSPLVTILGEEAVWPAIDTNADELSSMPSFAVQIDADWPCGTPIELHLSLSAVEAPGAWESTFSIPTGQFQAIETFAENVEGTVDGWTIESPSGSSPWVTSELRSSSPTRSWHVANPASVSETLLRMPVISAVPAGMVLRFEQFVDTEAGFDGGVLEYALDGSTWIDAGALIVEGGYNGMINPSQATPLTGRPAWTGDLDGWHTVTVDLSSFAGSDLLFRWRFASDLTTGDEGWYVDDIVAVVETHECSAGMPDLPGESSAPGTSVAPFTIDLVDDGVRLSWDAPPSGGSVTDYVLYSMPIGAVSGEPVCETLLGAGTEALLASLPDSRAFLVVARNASGEGSYGTESSGAPRVTATDQSCPAGPAPKTTTRNTSRGPLRGRRAPTRGL